MLGVFKMIIFAVRRSVYWNKALDAAAEGRYQDSQGFLRKIEETVTLSGRQKLLLGYLFYATQQYEKAHEIFSEICQKIDGSNRLSPDEKSYLMCYTSVLGTATANELGLPSTEFRYDYSRVHLQEVRKFLKQQFPLRDHPDWKKAGV